MKLFSCLKKAGLKTGKKHSLLLSTVSSTEITEAQTNLQVLSILLTGHLFIILLFVWG